VNDVVPLFATLSTGTRTFAEVLPAAPNPGKPSPWSPKDTAADEATLRAAIEKAKREAIEQGRAEGLRETESLRTRLKQLVAELEKSREIRAERYADAIAEAAVTAIEAWVSAYDRVALFQPIVRGWITAGGDATAAIARVNPADTAAMKTAIGDAPIRVEGDPKMKAGDVELRGEALDTTHIWHDRLRELRDAIATAIETEPGLPEDEVRGQR
jgi:flagellar biosynthesis/type III secretory pathway protein FliH